MGNPLPIFVGLLLGLAGIFAIHYGVEERRATIAVGGFLILLAGAGLAILAVATLW
jgi:hypothetical protein